MTAATAEIGRPRQSKLGAVLRVTSGNFLEQFDFFLFGFYATYIAKTFFPGAQRICLAHADLQRLWRGISHAAAGGDHPRRLHRPSWTSQGTYRDPVDHGQRHDADRLRSGLRDDRSARAAAGADRPPAAGVLGRRGTRRGFGLSGGNGHAGPPRLLHQLAIGEPAGCHCRGRRRSAIAVNALDGDGRNRRLGLAHSLFRWVHDRAVHFPAPTLASGDRGIPGAQASSRRARNSSNPWLRNWAVVLEGDAARRDDDDDLLSHHGVHANVWHDGAQAQRRRQPHRYPVRRHNEFLLAADRGRAVGSHRPAAPAARDHHLGHPYRLPAAVVARSAPSFERLLLVLLLVFVLLRHVQRRDGRDADGGHATAGAGCRFLARV